MDLIKHLSMERKSLKYKILIAFALMSVIPLLVIAYFVVNYVFPVTDNLTQATLIVVAVLWVSWTGYVLIKQIINPVIDLALETRIIADGRFGSKVAIDREDELGDIAEAVNTMTSKIRGYIGELQDYSKKTALLNIQIHRKVITLTNLMQLGDLISTGATFEEIAKFAADKMASEVDGSFCAIYVKEKTGKYIFTSASDDSGREVNFDAFESRVPELEKLLGKEEFMLVDGFSPEGVKLPLIQDILGTGNFVLFPMQLNRKIIGFIVLGNYLEAFDFADDIMGVIRAFEKELVLGYHSTKAYEKVKSLEVVDSLTGLYTRAYLEERFQDEINRSIFYQRPCSIILINLDNFGRYIKNYGAEKAKKVLADISGLLRGVMSPVGKVARFSYDEFAMLVPEKNKRETIEVAEDIRKKIEAMNIAADINNRVTASIGVGENPIDGMTSEEIITRTYVYLRTAKERGKNIVIAG